MAEKEIEMLSRQVRPRHKSKSRERGVSAGGTAVRASKSDTCQTGKKEGKKKERSRSETRTKEVGHSTFAEAKERLKKQATEAVARTEAGKKVISGLDKAANAARGARDMIRAINDFGSSGESIFGDDDDINEEMGAGIQPVLDWIEPEEDATVPNVIAELKDKFEEMEIDDHFNWPKKREREEPSMDSPPRKIRTPEPRPLSAINEVGNEIFVGEAHDPTRLLGFGLEGEEEEEDDQDLAAEVIQLSDRILADSWEKDKIIEDLKAKLALQGTSVSKMIEERDAELRTMQEQEKEAHKMIERLKRDLAEEKANNAKAEKQIQSLTMQMDDEQEESRGKVRELKGKLDAAKAQLADMTRELEKVQSANCTFKAELRHERDNLGKKDQGHKKEMDAVERLLAATKDELRRVTEKSAKKVEDAEMRYTNLKKHYSQYRSGLRRYSSSKGGSVLAIDGELSSGEETSKEESDESEDDQKVVSKVARPQDIEALIDSRLVWPKYEQANDHSDFVDRCWKAANRAMERGIPANEVATNLNVYIKKKLYQCNEKFEALRDDDDKDKPLEETLEML